MKCEILDIPVKVFLGVNTEEKSHKQEVLISVFFEFDSALACSSDDIGHTIDYQEIYDFIRQFPADKKFNLLEKFHSDIFSQLIQAFPKMQKVNLRIEKFPFPKGSVVINK
jgi:dihydroneopterin aldolase